MDEQTSVKPTLTLSDLESDLGQSGVRQVRESVKPQVTGSESRSERSDAPKTSLTTPPVGGGQTCGLTLRALLEQLKRAGSTLTLQSGGRWHLDREHPHASATVTRHRHALSVAAARTHPAWWGHVTGRAPLSRLDLDTVPTVDCPDTADGLAYACACCGRPGDHLDDHLLAWCRLHRATLPWERK
jgi:hypothetical protein